MKYKVPRDIKEFIRPLLDLGWVLTKNKHFKLNAPNGKCISFSATPSDDHTLHNIKRDMKKIGY